MNAHVIKYCRWKWWLASRYRNQLGMLHWATQERLEIDTNWKAVN